MRLPWTAKRSSQSILKEISPEYSLEGLMLRLQFFGQWMRRADSLEKTLMLGKIKSRKRRGRQRMRLLYGIINSIDLSLSKFWETVKDRGARRAAVQGVTKSWIYLMMKPTDLGSSSFSTLSFCLFILFIWFSRQEY